MRTNSNKLAKILFAATIALSALPGAWAEDHKSTSARAAQEKSVSSESETSQEQAVSSDTDTAKEQPVDVESANGKDEAGQGEDEKAAEEEQSRLLRVSESEAYDHYDLARYYCTRLNLKMAELEYQAAIMYLPSLKVAHRDYCLISLFRGHPLRAIAEMMMVVGLGEPIPLSDDEKTALKARGVQMHFHEGLSYGRHNRWNKAIAELKWALTYSPDNAAVERWLAFSYARTGNFELAERSYARVFADDPDDGYSHADFAFLLSENGREDQAIKQLSEAVKLEPKVAALHVDMGWIAESKGDLSTAQREFREAIQLSPRHAQLWTHLGKVLERQGNKTEAQTAYSQAVAIDPGQDDARKRLLELKNETSKEQPPQDNSQARKQS